MGTMVLAIADKPYLPPELYWMLSHPNWLSVLCASSNRDSYYLWDGLRATGVRQCPKTANCNHPLRPTAIVSRG